MDQKDWHLIDELYKNKNITKTAEKLFVSQPSLSYRLKRIEQELGVSLFFKTKKGIGFTSEGDYLAKRARDMIDSYHKMKDHLLNMQEQVSGTLRIALQATTPSIYFLKY